MIYVSIYLFIIYLGEEVPREDVNQDHRIGGKIVFHCGKIEIFHFVFFIVMFFNYGSIFFVRRS
jgi:hypothetical protein